ncbi:MAG: phosphopantetheine-binding protein [Verrucomicrobiota bacterium]
MSKTLSAEQIADLRSSFRRCSDETVQAILAYRQETDGTHIPVIVRGIIERFLPAESIAKFKGSGDETRLSEDLGIDSLTMLEIVVSVEEALDMRMEDSQMRQIRTLGDIKSYLANRVSGQGEETAAGSSRKFNSQAVKLSLPQQFPFLFVDQAEIEGDVVRATYQVKGDEFFLDGHFPKNIGVLG